MTLILLAPFILIIHPFLLNAHIIWFVRWCTVLLGRIMKFFYISPRVAKWASEGHNLLSSLYVCNTMLVRVAKWASLCLSRHMELFYIGPRVAKWASEGHNLLLSSLYVCNTILVLALYVCNTMLREGGQMGVRGSHNLLS